MKRKVNAGITSLRLQIFIQDSTSTTGGGLTGLVHNSSGLTWYYLRDGDSSATSVSIVTATVGTYTSGGFKEVDATNMPGVYEIGIPNAAVASGARSVVMILKGATNMVIVPVEIELDAVDYQDATDFGLSAFTNAKLASDGLDAIDITMAAGLAANFPEMTVQLWRRFFKRHVYDGPSGLLITYDDDDTTWLTQQEIDSSGTYQSIGTATEP